MTQKKDVASTEIGVEENEEKERRKEWKRSGDAEKKNQNFNFCLENMHDTFWIYTKSKKSSNCSETVQLRSFTATTLYPSAWWPFNWLFNWTALHNVRPTER